MNEKYAVEILRDVELINSRLADMAFLKASGEHWDIVLEAENYSISAGGKRVRGVLLIEFYRLFAKTCEIPDYVLDAACAIEMTHTFSLIHDDMPEMDNDDMRRGKPSTHKAFGSDIALLAGDGLAILPYEVLSCLALEGSIPSARAIELISILSSGAGNRGMIAGQMLDLWSEKRGDEIDEAFLYQMSALKTGRLIAAPCLMGAVLGGAGETEKLDAAKYAENIGFAFQMIDDVLDVTSDVETLGKPIGSDIERQKPTFVDVLGIEKTKEKAKSLSCEAAEILEKYANSELLREFAVSLVDRNN